MSHCETCTCDDTIVALLNARIGRLYLLARLLPLAQKLEEIAREVEPSDVGVGES